jgi:hypothetical protein
MGRGMVRVGYMAMAVHNRKTSPLAKMEEERKAEEKRRGEAVMTWEGEGVRAVSGLHSQTTWRRDLHSSGLRTHWEGFVDDFLLGATPLQRTLWEEEGERRAREEKRRRRELGLDERGG